MFELPAVLPQDHEQDTSAYNARAIFRSMETEEIQQIASGQHPTPDYPKFVEKIKRKVYLKGVEEVEEYIGLVSHAVFDSQGNFKGDAFSEAQATAGGARVHPKVLREVTSESRGASNDNEDTENDIHMAYADTIQLASDGKLSTLGKQMAAWYAGMELLPRNTCRPQVWMDDPATQKFVHDARTGASNILSERSLQVLMRSNYRAPFGLKFCYHDDPWHNTQFMRRRSMQVVVSILYICLERREYERAWNALGCLLRERYVDVRLLWMPALELLAWRHSVRPSSKTPEDFIDWLIMNFPDISKLRARLHRERPGSVVFVPISIMIKLVNGNYAEAMNQAEQAINSAQYTNDAMCWALCGLARLKLERTDEQTIRCFKKCIELGGVVPRKLRKQVIDLCSTGHSEEALLDEYSEVGSSDSDESEVENINIGITPYEKENHSTDDDNNNDDEDVDDDGHDDNDHDDNDDDDNDDDSDQESVSSETSESSSGMPAAKRMKTDTEVESGISEHDIPSSQPFFSQAQTLGGEMGSSDSDEDFL